MNRIVGLYGKNKINQNKMENIKKTVQKFTNNEECFRNYSDINLSLFSGYSEKSKNLNEKDSTQLFSEDVILLLNGNIYNYSELIKNNNLKNQIENLSIILDLYHKIGINFLKQLDGDFILVIYDKKQEKLYLCRDKVGVKSFYYTIVEDIIYFSSEIKTLFKFDGIKPILCVERLIGDFVLSFWNERNKTYFENIYQINAGEYLEVMNTEIKSHKYWDIDCNVENISLEEIEKTLIKSTLDKISGQVRYATLLSGGLDSSLLSAICAKNSNNLTSYTIKYADEENNSDFEYSKKVSEMYKNINHKINFLSREGITTEQLDNLTWHMEEVIWDKVYFSMWKNYNNAKLDGFDVIINGQGSDEIWAGYYHDFEHYKFNYENLANVEFMFNYFYNLNIGYDNVLSTKAINIVKKILNNIVLKYIGKTDDVINDISYWATKTYLQSNLNQEEKMSMVSYIECRVPFASHKLIELGFKISGKEKVQNKVEKNHIKEISRKFLPKDIVDRRKQAFVNPSKTYNESAIIFIKTNWERIKSNKYIKEIFSADFLLSFDINGTKGYDGEFFWKIYSIIRFLDVFNLA